MNFDLSTLLASIDLYCERTGPEAWSEPLNFLSNASFLLIGWFIFRRYRETTSRRLQILGINAFAIGLGSGLFHMLPSRLTQIFDVIPIAIFVAITLYLYVDELKSRDSRWQITLAACLLTFVLLPILARVSSLSLYLAHGEFYLGIVPALLIMAGRESLLAKRCVLFFAAIAFGLAYFARTVDLPFCDAWPSGTHWLWHLLTATVAWLMASLEWTSQSRRN